jgi:hypothetical protein
MTMTTYTGNQEVDPGLYLNTRRFTIASIEHRSALPGIEDDHYRRIPLLLMLAAAPLVGLIYVIFLPLIGFGAVSVLLAGKAAEAAANVGVQMGRVRRPAWVPTIAYFSRGKKKTTDEASEQTTMVQDDAWTKEIEKKLDESERSAR